MKTNYDGTITLNAYDTWTSCVACGQRVTGDSIHTCSPQLKPLSDEEIHELANEYLRTQNQDGCLVVLGLEDFARAIEERHGIK